jgi:hypothetical protein
MCERTACSRAHQGMALCAIMRFEQFLRAEDMYSSAEVLACNAHVSSAMRCAYSSTQTKEAITASRAEQLPADLILFLPACAWCSMHARVFHAALQTGAKEGRK